MRYSVMSLLRCGPPGAARQHCDGRDMPGSTPGRRNLRLSVPRPGRGGAGACPLVVTDDAAGSKHARRRRQLSGASGIAVVLDQAALLEDPADQPPAGEPDVLVEP